MKIKCPNCDASYNIDISKIPVIPEGGITTTCKKCNGKIPIKMEDRPQREERRDQIIPCPECGHVNISTETCVQSNGSSLAPMVSILFTSQSDGYFALLIIPRNFYLTV